MPHFKLRNSYKNNCTNKEVRKKNPNKNTSRHFIILIEKVNHISRLPDKGSELFFKMFKIFNISHHEIVSVFTFQEIPTRVSFKKGKKGNIIVNTNFLRRQTRLPRLLFFCNFETTWKKQNQNTKP